MVRSWSPTICWASPRTFNPGFYAVISICLSKSTGLLKPTGKTSKAAISPTKTSNIDEMVVGHRIRCSGGRSNCRMDWISILRCAFFAQHQKGPFGYPVYIPGNYPGFTREKITRHTDRPVEIRQGCQGDEIWSR